MTGKDFSGPTPVIAARKTLDLRENDVPPKQMVPGDTGRNSDQQKAETAIILQSSGGD